MLYCFIYGSLLFTVSDKYHNKTVLYILPKREVTLSYTKLYYHNQVLSSSASFCYFHFVYCMTKHTFCVVLGVILSFYFVFKFILIYLGSWLGVLQKVMIKDLWKAVENNERTVMVRNFNFNFYIMLYLSLEIGIFKSLLKNLLPSSLLTTFRKQCLQITVITLVKAHGLLTWNSCRNEGRGT